MLVDDEHEHKHSVRDTGGKILQKPCFSFCLSIRGYHSNLPPLKPNFQNLRGGKLEGFGKNRKVQIVEKKRKKNMKIQKKNMEI